MESQRYVKYNEVSFVDPEFRDPRDPKRHVTWETRLDRADVRELYDQLTATCSQASETYRAYISRGVPPEDARSVLPNCTATAFYTTANLRAWRHIFKERCNVAAQHNIQRLMRGLLIDFHRLLPVCFDDLVESFIPWGSQSLS